MAEHIHRRKNLYDNLGGFLHIGKETESTSTHSCYLQVAETFRVSRACPNSNEAVWDFIF